MEKTLCFKYQGIDYVLEFTRDTIRSMEKRGFRANEIENTPMSVLPDLFAGAFLAHHRFTKRATIDEIFSHITNKSELIGKLSEMYNEPLVALMSDPEESEGNIEWTASF